MVPFFIISLNFGIAVADGFVGHEVRAIGFLHQHITDILFVTNKPGDHSLHPLFASRIQWRFLFIENLRDFFCTDILIVKLEDFSDHLSLRFIDHIAFSETIRRSPHRLAQLVSVSDATLDVLRNGAAFLLGKSCKDGKQKLRGEAGSIQPFLLEVHTDTMRFQLSCVFKRVLCVSGKS